jgi:L-seryl-tRNA(Ser) seleniumtransferase
MANPKTAELAVALRLLPSTDELLTTQAAKRLLPETGPARLASLARQAIAQIRSELTAGVSGGSGHSDIYSKEVLLAESSTRLVGIWAAQRASRLRKVINATGVVNHTNLGRAPLSDEAIAAIESAAGYVTLEYDLAAGRRGGRGASVERLLTELTGAEAAVIVNNCAAAAFLVLSVFAKGREVIVSRGELVEIGGDFRIPDVLAQSGAKLVEVGTTNRTRLADYENSISDSTGLILRVHPSNYRIVGFTQRPSVAELAAMCRARNIALCEDAGSGALVDLSDAGLTDEPLIRTSIEDGADIVTFSGDKLLGSAQAGLIVGRRDYIERLRKHPLYRALRVDKLAYAALEATLEAYLREDLAAIPVLRMLTLTRSEIETRARAFIAVFEKMTDLRSAEIVVGESVVGGGSAPAVPVETVLIALRHATLSADAIEERLRSAETPVIARIENDAVVIDLRTVDAAEEKLLLEALAGVFG